MRRTRTAWAVTMLALALASTAVAQTAGSGSAGTTEQDDAAQGAATTGATAGAGATGGAGVTAGAGSDAEAEGAATNESDPTAIPSDAAANPAAQTEMATAGQTQEMDAGTYAVRLRDLEQRINELKEQIFRSKARLSLLAETVLQGVVAGAQAVIVHENRMSSSYRLVKAVYALDGAPIFNRADEEGSLAEREEFEVYNGSIVPGEHSLT